MKVRKLSTLILRLKVLNLICSEPTIFFGTLSLFLTPTLLIWGIKDMFPILFVMFCHYLAYTFKFQKIYREMLPEKRKIECVINILKKRRLERQ